MFNFKSKQYWAGIILLVLTFLLTLIFNSIVISSDPSDLEPGYASTVGIFNMTVYPLGFILGAWFLRGSYYSSQDYQSYQQYQQ